uniref:Structural protein n=1 Tax=Siphoviridae sp. ct5op20 TaxID=2826295 RepID=A0A8S5NR31_9CAUD|nr:MAG TPA: structural protein [Siphoviridae sp. ct5op20]
MVFIAGVGNATLFDGERLVASANTLIDSGITIGLSFEDVRAGQGNKLYGRYAHTSTFDLKLTDAMFNLEYLAMNTGSDISLGGDVMVDEELTSTTKKIKLSQTAVAISGSKVYAYAKKSGTDNVYDKYAVSETNEIEVPVDGTYCIRYMYTNDLASRMIINANFIPKTLTLILEANLYSGGSCDIETSTLAGKVTIKVPRFMLNGSQELSLTASGVANTSIEGSALASGCAGCSGEGVYAEIIQVMANRTAENGFTGIVVEDAVREASKGDKLELNVYACPVDAAPIKLNNDQFTVAATGTGYTYANGIVTIAEDAAGTVTVEVTAKAPLDSLPTASLNVTIK